MTVYDLAQSSYGPLIPLLHNAATGTDPICALTHPESLREVDAGNASTKHAYFLIASRVVEVTYAQVVDAADVMVPSTRLWPSTSLYAEIDGAQDSLALLKALGSALVEVGDIPLWRKQHLERALWVLAELTAHGLTAQDDTQLVSRLVAVWNLARRGHGPLLLALHEAATAPSPMRALDALARAAELVARDASAMCAVAALIGQWVSEAQSQEFVGASEISSSQGVEAMVHYAALRRAACLASLAKALARTLEACWSVPDAWRNVLEEAQSALREHERRLGQ